MEAVGSVVVGGGVDGSVVDGGRAIDIHVGADGRAANVGGTIGRGAEGEGAVGSIAVGKGADGGVANGGRGGH